MRTVEKVVAPIAPHFVGDGFRVHNFIPHAGLQQVRLDPFILLDYNSKFYFAPTEQARGVGVHPHRGFETITIAYEGSVAHHDSGGGGGVIGEGEVQWMTAAKGVLHKEYHEENFSKNGGYFHMVQLWVNLPAAYKMSEPKYQTITREKMQIVNLPEQAGTIEVIAGNYEQTQGAASTFTPIHMMNAKLNAGGKVGFNFPKNYNTALLVIAGSVTINDTTVVPQDHFVLMKNDDIHFELSASEQATVLVFSGEPINEPIVQHGPFVMNTRAEIVQAFDDFNKGHFGFLED